MNYQPHARRKTRRQFRVTNINYAFLRKLAELQGISVACALDGILNHIRKTDTPFFTASSSHVQNGSCQMSR